MFPTKVPMNIGGEDFIFDNAEAAFQAQKNPALAKLFVGLNGFDAKRKGRQVPITTPDWNTARNDAMRKAVQAKFDNNPEIMEQLKALADEYISEDNTWGDTYWGISGGKGQNMLGKILMDVRDNAIVAAPIADTITDITPTPADDLIVDNGLNALAAESGLENTGEALRKLYTSNYFNPETNILPTNYAISRGIPRQVNPNNFHDDVRWLLAPSKELLNGYNNGSIGEAEYTKQYLDYLNNNESQILGAVGNLPNQAILDCWEPSGKFCHRNLLSQWFRDHGVDMTEWQPGTHLDPQTVEGNLLDTDIPLILQQVNNGAVINGKQTAATMGAGLAAQIRQDLSNDSYQLYVDRATGPARLGKVLPLKSISHPNRTYLNIIAQNGWGNYRVSSADQQHAWLEDAFRRIAEKYPGQSVAMPVGMGAKLGGGDWDTIERLADEILGPKMNLFKYKLPK